MIFIALLLSFNIYTDLLSVRNYKSYTSRISWRSRYGIYINTSMESNFDRLLSKGINSTLYQVGYEKSFGGDRRLQITTGFGFKLEKRGNTEIGRRNLLVRAIYEAPVLGLLRINPSIGFDFLEYFGTGKTSLDNSGPGGSFSAEILPLNARLLFFFEDKNLYMEKKGEAEINRVFDFKSAKLFLKYDLERRYQRYTIQREESLRNTHHGFNILLKKRFSTWTRLEASYNGDFNNLDYGRGNIKTNSRNRYSFDFRFFTKFSFLNLAFEFQTGGDILDYRVIKNDEFVKSNRLSLDIQKTGNLFGGLSMDVSIDRYNYPELFISPQRDSRNIHLESFIGFNLKDYTNVLKFSGTRHDLSYIKSFYSANSKYTYRLYLTDRSFYTRGTSRFFTEFELFSQFSLFPYDPYRGIYTRYFLNSIGLKRGESNLWQVAFKFQDQGSFVKDIETGDYFYVKRVSIFEVNFVSTASVGEWRGVGIFSKNTLTVRYKKPVNSEKMLEIKDLGMGIAFQGESLNVELSRVFRFRGKDYFTLSASYSRSL